MLVAFRVDASAQMGTGHVRRSLALAHALNDIGARVVFITRALGVDSEGLIAGAGFECITLPAPQDGGFTPDTAIAHAHWSQVTTEQDAHETVSALTGHSPDWVVLDSYSFGAAWHDHVRDGLDCRIAQIDDLADRELACDLVIDHNFAHDHRAKYEGQLQTSPRLLGGPRFALLGPAYAKAPIYEFNRKVRSIGVFMGGADIDNFSSRALDAIAAAGFEGALELVTTRANPNLSALEDQVARTPNASLSLDLAHLADFFARHDLHIGAGGGATWERCCIGAPSLLVAIAQNQMVAAPLLAKAGVVDYATDPSPQALSAAVGLLIADPERRASLAGNARQLVDGKGALRVALALMADRLTVRRAAQDDAQRLFDWRNAPENRRRMNDKSEFSWDSHKAWLARVIGDPQRALMIGEVGGAPVGVIRFDDLGEEWPEVSLHLDPDLSGLGLGPYLLLAGEAAVNAAKVRATVLSNNRPSQKLFEGCGYTRTGPESWEKRIANARIAS